MFTYLFLLAAAATSSELPTTDLTAIEASSFAEATADMQEIQELVAIFTQEETAPETFTAATLEPTPTLVALATSPITITNAIEPSMLAYKHWTGTYSPETFTVAVNGTEVEQGKACEIPAGTTAVEVQYKYSFMSGMRTGGKKISYQLNENVTQANITFNWKDDWRVIVDNGKAIKEINA
ncbi:MAG TPA: hypothetical protein VJJ26_03750 [Candidatus Babeliales bacterium]|nr:hypothetical protein [Candidatus Babeliales bacterium]